MPLIIREVGIRQMKWHVTQTTLFVNIHDFPTGVPTGKIRQVQGTEDIILYSIILNI